LYCFERIEITWILENVNRALIGFSADDDLEEKFFSVKS
jgi:hypothetical protein